MRHEPLTIDWSGVTVGQLIDFETHNFVLLGKWEPVGTAVSELFLDELRQGDTVVVHCGGMDATIYYPPMNGMMEIRMFPCEEAETALRS